MVEGMASSNACSGPRAGMACYRSVEPTCSGHRGLTAPTLSQSDVGKSPVRESRPPGSVGEALNNRRLYPTGSQQVFRWRRAMHQDLPSVPGKTPTRQRPASFLS